MRAMPQRHKDAPPEAGPLRADRVARAPASTTTSATRRPTGSPRSRSTGPRSATPSGRRRWSSSRDAFELARDDLEVGAIILTGAGDGGLLLRRRPADPRRHGYIGDDEVAQQGVGRFDVTDLHVQIRRLPKPVVAMVAGYAVGGGHILHLVCDLTIAADNARFGQTGPRVGSFDGGFGASPPGATSSGPRRRRSSGCSAACTTPRRRWRWAWSTRSSRSTELERETVAWCREMLAPLPLRPAPGQGQLQRRRGRLRRDPAARPRRHPALLRQRGGARRAATPSSRSASPTSPSSRKRRDHEDLGDGGAAADAAGGDRAGPGRHRGGGRSGSGTCRAWGAFIAALVGSIFIQIGTNLANDYSDARRGADTADRLGPVRVTSAGLVTPQRVLSATWIAFARRGRLRDLPGDRGRDRDPR